MDILIKLLTAGIVGYFVFAIITVVVIGIVFYKVMKEIMK